MRRSRRRLLALFVSLPLLVIGVALAYSFGMAEFEGSPRTFMESLEWAAETLTSTGYGRDNQWQHPVMSTFVVLIQFAGTFLFFMIVPLILVPFFEERFEGRLPKDLPDLKGHVVIYGWGPAVTQVAEELGREKIPLVVVEENELTARRLRDRGMQVVFAQLEEDELDLTKLEGARAVIANGDDANNAVLVLSARQQQFEGPIVALVDSPSRRNPMIKAGATAAFTPMHVLAAAIAAKASAKINPRVAGVQGLGGALEVAELRIHTGSSLAGKTLAEADVRKETGATIIGEWVGGELVPQPSPSKVIKAGTILVAAGSEGAMDRLSNIARPITSRGHIVLIGSGQLQEKVDEFLTMAGEEVRTLGEEASSGVDLVGDVLDPELLEKADIANAQAIVLALENDATTLFAAAMIRDLVPEAVIVASSNRADNIARMHRAGADFAMSVSQVAGQLLTFNILGEESVELQPQLKIVKQPVAPRLIGQNPVTIKLRERTNCSLVAVERGGTVLVELDKDFHFEEEDTLYMSGSPEAVQRFHDTFGEVDRQLSGGTLT